MTISLHYDVLGTMNIQDHDDVYDERDIDLYPTAHYLHQVLNNTGTVNAKTLTYKSRKG